MTLDAMAEGGKGRFVFGSASVPDDFANVGNTIPASKAPNAFALVPDPATPGPGVVPMLPYGEAMRAPSALLDVDRGTDGIVRHITPRRDAGDWALHWLATPVARAARDRPARPLTAASRGSWR